MNNEQPESIITRIEAIEKQLSQLALLSERVTRLEEKLAMQKESKESPILGRVTNLEEKIELVADIDRYLKLRSLLAHGEFKAADEETTNVMLDIAGHERDTLTPDDIKKFSCNALRVIDRLWLTHSKQHFGFSVQLKIYQSVGGNMNTLMTQDTNVLKKFAEKVGWFENNKNRFEQYEEWDFSLDAPAGSFPAIWWKSPYGLKMVTFFFSRLLTCKIEG